MTIAASPLPTPVALPLALTIALLRRNRRGSGRRALDEAARIRDAARPGSFGS